MMKLVASVLALSATTIAHVLPWSMNHFVARDAPQAVTLIFQGGPASYSLNISADGQEHLTSKPGRGEPDRATDSEEHLNMHGIHD